MAAAKTSVDACRSGEERDDDQCAQEVDQREQMFLAVSCTERAEEVGADRVEEPDQCERACSYARRHAANLQIRRYAW